MIVADTDVLIDFMKGKGAARSVASALERGLATTVVSAFELWAGSIGSRRRETAVEKLLAALEVIPLDPASALEAAHLKTSLRSRGTTIGTADALIAGMCVSRGAVLLTRNKKDFTKVPGLTLG